MARLILLAAVIACLTLSGRSVAQSSPPQGFAATYVGGAWVGRDFRPAQIDMGDSTAYLTMPLEGLTRRPASSIDRSQKQIAYRFVAGRLSIGVSPAGTDPRGTLKIGETEYELSMHRVAQIRPERIDSLVGLYRTAGGELIHIDARRPGLSGLPFYNESTGRVGTLYPESESVFLGGPARLVPFPKRVIAEFGNVNGRLELTLREDDYAPVRAVKVPLPWTTTEVRIPSTGATLAGTLYLPRGSTGKLPAVVLVHGSDPNTRFAGITPEFFARVGLAVLTFDKRGNGQSTGDFTRATFDTLARDVGAAVDFLARDSRVDATRIGLWGISQGGWVAPLAMLQGAPVAFAILHSGATLSPREQGRDELRSWMRLSGATPEETKRAEAFQQLYVDVLVDPRRRRSLDSLYAVEQGRGSTWIWSPQAADAPSARWFGRVADYDPAPALQRIKVPVLALFGAADPLVPPERHVGPLLEALQQANNRDVTVVVFPRANHRLEVEVPGVIRDWPVTSRLVPYFPQMEAWLKRILSPPA